MERTNFERAVVLAGAAATFSFAALLDADHAQAADISTPETTIVLPTSSPEQEIPSEQFKYIAKLASIPAYRVVTEQEASSMSPEALAAYSEQQPKQQDILSGWVEFTETAATSPTSNFYSTDFSATISTITQSGESYKVPEARLTQDVPLQIKDQSSIAPKGSMLIPYSINEKDLAVAVMSDKVINNDQTTVGYSIAFAGESALAIPSRFSSTGELMAVLEFFPTQSGELEPREVSVQEGIVTSFDSNIRNPQKPTEVIGTIQKGTKIKLIGDAQQVSEMNFQVTLAVTPSWELVNLADTVFKRVDNTTHGVNASGSQEQATSSEAFWANYHWQMGDVVKLNKTGVGKPSDVSGYWNMSINRGGVVYNNLSLVGQAYGGEAKPLGMQLRPEYTYPTYISELVYLDGRVYEEEENGVSRKMYSLILALPSQDGQETLVVESVSPENHNPGFSMGGSEITMMPVQKFFDQITHLTTPGSEIKVDISQIDDVSVIKKDWEAYFKRPCETDPNCNARMFAFDPKNSTNSEVIYNWWKSRTFTGDVVIGSDGLIRLGALTQVIISPQRGAILSSS
jgi:hypothetical protein